MSIRLMSAVWDSGRYEGGTLLVLLALADWANDDGTDARPGLETLSAKARLSVRQTQRALRRLEEDGIIVAVQSEKGGRGKITHYRIIVKRVTSCPKPDDQNERVTLEVKKGDIGGSERVTSATQRVTSGTSHIDNHQEPPEIHQDTPSGAREDLPAAKAKKPRAFSSGFEAFWVEVRKCPGFSANMSKQSAWAAWERAADRPSDAQMIAAAIGWRKFLETANALRRTSNPHPMAHPSTWLHERRWEGFLAGAEEAKAAVADNAEIVAEISERLQPYAEKIISAIGRDRKDAEAKLCAWFVTCSLIEPETLRFGNKFHCEHVGREWGNRLKRIFSDDLKLQHRPQAVRAA